MEYGIYMRFYGLRPNFQAKQSIFHKINMFNHSINIDVLWEESFQIARFAGCFKIPGIFRRNIGIKNILFIFFKTRQTLVK